jgi:hypothetical protein
MKAKKHKFQEWIITVRNGLHLHILVIILKYSLSYSATPVSRLIFMVGNTVQQTLNRGVITNSKQQINVLKLYRKSRDSSVGIALGYGLDDWNSRVRFPAGAGNFSLHHCVQNGSGAHPAYPMGTRGSFPGGKAAGA